MSADTGAQVWQQPMAGMGQRPALVPWGQERLVAVTSGGDVRVLEAGTGRVQHTWDVGKQVAWHWVGLVRRAEQCRLRLAVGRGGREELGLVGGAGDRIDADTAAYGVVLLLS